MRAGTRNAGDPTPATFPRLGMQHSFFSGRFDVVDVDSGEELVEVKPPATVGLAVLLAAAPELLDAARLLVALEHRVRVVTSNGNTLGGRSRREVLDTIAATRILVERIERAAGGAR